MMDKGRICILTLGGTRGDVLPAIALGSALRDRGFEIVVLGDSTYEKEARSAGLAEHEWVNGSDVSLSFLMRTGAGQRWLWNSRPHLKDRWMEEELIKHWERKVASFLGAVGAASDTRIVAAIASISAWHFMDRFHPGCARIISCPMPYAPSKEFTLDPPDLSPFGKAKARLWRLLEDRRMKRRFLEETYHLVNASPTLFPRPRDWASSMQVTGYTPPAPPGGDWRPPAALVEFLQRGDPPFYVGFGSYPFFFGEKGDKLARLFKSACESFGVRCILHSEDLSPELASDSTFLLRGGIPHTWLFPRCETIIHHGGYGTMHAALLAGRPMIIYPFQTDQFLWTRRMGEMGLGPGFQGRPGRLDARTVREDIAWALEGDRKKDAAAVGARLAAEDGVGAQVALIGSIIEHQRLGGRPVDWTPPRERSAEPF